MSGIPPCSFSIFVADSNPDGQRIVYKSNWVDKALRFRSAHVGDTN